VRPARQADIDVLVATLVESHLRYAWEVWAITGPDRRARIARAFRSDLETLGLPHGVVTMTDDGAAVAVWLPTGAEALLSDQQRDDRRRLSEELYGDRLHELEQVDKMIESALCPPADWQLATMGTRPSRQSHGLGTAVLQPMLDRLDQAQETARLETSTSPNLRFYRRHGFEVACDLDLPFRAPTTWVMHRRPAGV
jgi:ribosomal protein S18 acetylase RimI-like enzyme